MVPCLAAIITADNKGGEEKPQRGVVMLLTTSSAGLDFGDKGSWNSQSPRSAYSPSFTKGHSDSHSR